MTNFYDKKGGGDWKSGGGKGGYKGGYKAGGGGNKFGGHKGSAGGWKSGGSASDDRPALHSATCNKCGKSCDVPFKPNGKKPIYCRDCFRKEDGMDSAPRYGAKTFDRGDRGGSFEKPPYRSTPHAAPASDDVARQLKMLNTKMDAILKALTDLGEEATGAEMEESEDEGEA